MHRTARQPTELLVYRNGAQVRARILGPLDQGALTALQARLEALVRDHCASLTLDLVETDYVDSDAVRWLQRVDTALSQRSGMLRLVLQPGSRVERTLKLLQLDRVFLIDAYPADSSESLATPVA